MPKCSLADWAQIISAMGALAAAIFAAITTFQNHKENKENAKERRAMVKPIFSIHLVEENRGDKIYKFHIKNIGYSKLNSLDVIWEGIEGVNLNPTYKEFISFSIKLDFSEIERITPGKQGIVKIIYYDVLGNRGEASFPVSINIQDISHASVVDFSYELSEKLAGKILN